MPSELILLGLIIVFVLLFFVTGVENTIPVFIRTEFDNVGSYYLSTLQSNGGITTTDKNNIIAKLIDLGFTNIQITAPENVQWGEEARIIIKADFKVTQTNVDLNKETKTITATFDEKTIVMTLDGR